MTKVTIKQIIISVIIVVIAFITAIGLNNYIKNKVIVKSVNETTDKNYEESIKEHIIDMDLYNCQDSLFPDEEIKLIYDYHYNLSHKNLLYFCKFLIQNAKKDPQTVTIKKLPDLYLPDYFVRKDISQKTVVLKNGKVLIIYGYPLNNGIDAENAIVELFDPDTNKFKLIIDYLSFDSYNDVESYFSFKRYSPFVLPDGRVMLGDKVFNPDTESLTQINDPLTLRLSKYLSRFPSRDYSKKDFNLNVNTIFTDGKLIIEKGCNYPNGRSFDCTGYYLDDPINNKTYKTAYYKEKNNLNCIIKRDNKNFLFITSDVNEYSSVELYKPLKGIITPLVKKLPYLVSDPLFIDQNNLFFVSNPILIDLSHRLIFNYHSYPHYYLDDLYSKSLRINNEKGFFLVSGKAAIFDLKTKKYNFLKEVRFPYYNQEITLLKNGKILVTGGKYKFYNPDLDDEIEENIKNAYLITFK
jgi:hypothetical protein